MHDHPARWILDHPAIRAHLVGSVLSVELLGRYTPLRLHVFLALLRKRLGTTDYWALVIDAHGADMAISEEQLAALWQAEECPLAVRPCAVVFDDRRPGAREFYERLGVALAYGLPPRLIGAFEGALMAAAVHWAQARAENFRSERARREARASSRASSGKPKRKRGSGPVRS